MKPNPNIGHQQFARLQLHIGAECWLGSCGLQRNFCLQQLVYRFVGQTSLIIWWALAFHIRWGTGARLQTRYSWFGPGLGPSLFLFWSWSLPMTCTLVSSFPAAAGCSSLAAPLGASSRCKDEGWNPRKSCIASTLVSGEFVRNQGCNLAASDSSPASQGKVFHAESPCWWRSPGWPLLSSQLPMLYWFAGLEHHLPRNDLGLSGCCSFSGWGCMRWCCPWFELCGDLAGFTFPN